jgi:hypothetical protein
LITFSYWRLGDAQLARISFELSNHLVEYDIIIEQPILPHPIPHDLKRGYATLEIGVLPKRVIKAVPVSACVMEYTQNQIEAMRDGTEFIEWMLKESLLVPLSICSHCQTQTLCLEESTHYAGISELLLSARLIRR